MSEEARAAWCDAFVKASAALLNPPKTKTAKVKTRTGADYSYTYAALPDILNTVRDVLREYGLAVSQSVESGSGEAGVAITTRIYHEAGHVETFGPLWLPAGSSPQEYGSATTYGCRYSICAALGIAADEDDDGAAATKASGGEGRQSATGKGAASAPRPEESSAEPLPATADSGAGDAGRAAPGSTSSRRSATECGRDGHPAFADGEASCPDCSAPPAKVLHDRAKAGVA